MAFYAVSRNSVLSGIFRQTPRPSVLAEETGEEMRKEHSHLRPDFKEPYKYVIDTYDGRGKWQSTIGSLTYNEAQRELRRKRRHQKTKTVHSSQILAGGEVIEVKE